MSPQNDTTESVNPPHASRHRSSWTGYVLSLFFTAVGVILMLWSGSRGLLIALGIHDPTTKASLATLILEGIAGVLTSVFGFAMLVQATPSIDPETASAWALPEHRTFEDDLLPADENR